MAFEKFKRRALREEARCSFDDALFWHCAAATTAWTHPFDHWRDDDVERSLGRIARALAKPRATRPRGDRLVVQTSYLVDGGGHSELILMLVEEASGFEKYVVSSEWHDSHALAPTMLASLRAPALLCPQGLTPSRKVLWVYEQLAEVAPASIILNTAPNDVISVTACAMYREGGGARVLYYDQAETFYWCGAAFVDRLLEWRRYGALVAERLRGTSSDAIRLVPPFSRERNSARVGRAELGVPEGATLSISVGNYPKFMPDGYFDYAATVGRLMDEHPTHYHIVVGHGPRGDELKGRLKSGRVLWLGRRTDVDALLAASDFVIESFPLMGGLFRLDAMKAGRPMVAVSHPAWPAAFDTDAFGEDYPFVAASNEQILEHCRALIADESLRREVGESLRGRYETTFTRGRFSSALNGALRDDGERVELGDEPLEYDAEWFATLINSDPVDEERALRMVRELLIYTPTPTPAERLTGLARRARESVRYRIGF